jgi:hypothetical protein
MIKQLPDKYIRKAIFSAVNNIVVDTLTIPAYDSRVSGNTIPQSFYINDNANKPSKSND